MFYLEFKTFHIIMVVSWFAGLFYLPRIFVNLAMIPADSPAERDRLLLMAGKLYRFITPIGYAASISGLWLWLVVGLGGMWMNVKAALVVLLLVYNHYCRCLLSAFEAGKNTRSHIWYRWFNEVPTILLLASTILVVFKPF